MSMTYSDNPKQTLADTGWIVSKKRSTIEEVVFEIAERWQVKHDSLELREASRQGSGHYSDIYGLGVFPFHTDFAFLRIPPQFVLLEFIGSSSKRDTQLLKILTDRMDRQEINALTSEHYYSRASGSSVVTPLLSKSLCKNFSIFRLDPLYLRSTRVSRSSSSRAVESIIARSPMDRIKWDTGMCLLINNWSVVHARSNPVDTLIVEDRRFRRTCFFRI